MMGRPLRAGPAIRWGFCLAALLLPAGARAQVTRPIVLPEGVGELSVDLEVGLNRGQEGRLVGLSSGLAQDRQPGLSVAYGLARGIEGGLFVPYVNLDLDRDLVESYNLAMGGWPLQRDTRTRNHFGPVGVFAGFRLAPWVAVEVTALVPIEQLRANRIAIRGSLPIRYALLPGRLAIRFRPDLVLGFGRSDKNQGASVQASFFVDAGLLYQPIPALWLDLGIGYGRMLQPSPSSVLREWPGDPNPPARGTLPLSLTIGYCITPSVDLWGGFSLSNLVAPSGAADARNLNLGVNYRF